MLVLGYFYGGFLLPVYNPIAQFWGFLCVCAPKNEFWVGILCSWRHPHQLRVSIGPRGVTQGCHPHQTPKYGHNTVQGWFSCVPGGCTAPNTPPAWCAGGDALLARVGVGLGCHGARCGMGNVSVGCPWGTGWVAVEGGVLGVLVEIKG